MELASPKKVGDQYVPQIIPNIEFNEVYLSPTNKINISLIQRGSWMTKSFMEYLPPKLEEYTFFTLNQYFFIYWAILLLQCLVIITSKYFTSEQFRKLKYYEKIFHTMECTNFAFPCHDWDHKDGDGYQHYLRMLANRKEVKINLLINTIFNLIMLTPLPVLCKILNYYFNLFVCPHVHVQCLCLHL